MKRSAGSWVYAALLAAGLVGSAGAADDGDGRYIVKFREFNGAAAAVAAAGGRVALELGPQRAVAAYLPEPALQALRNNPRVEYVEVDARRYPLAQTMPYGIDMVQADDPVFTADSSPAGNGAMVCIIDSGYQLAHEDLQESNVNGTNDSGTGNWFEDTCGHGTHVAGTIAALSNKTGVVGVVGSGALNLHIEKVFDGPSCGWAYSSSLVTALNRCRTAAGSNKLVVSMSLGGGRSSSTENTAFQNAYNAGVLPIAAAGNDGSTRTSYPAGYASVVSVAAVDSAGVVASFSQKNADVELAAPGVGVVSTTPFKPASLSVGSNTWLGTNIDGSARDDVTGLLVDGGLCDSVGSDWNNMVVLCARGVNTFAQKVSNVQSGNGAGAVIYNNVPGGFAATLNGTSAIPAIAISQEDGQAAKTALGEPSTLVNSAVPGDGYEAYDGTSMATPHVSGVAALVWSLNPGKTAAQVREALQKTALEKGAAGRDNSYGYGIVQAKAAHDFLQKPVVVTPPTLNSVTKVKVKNKNYARLSWSGADGTSVDYYRNSTKFSTPNDGSQDDGPLTAGTYVYKVCLTSTDTCSGTISIIY